MSEPYLHSLSLVFVTLGLLDVELGVPGLPARNGLADGTAGISPPRPCALAFLELDGSLARVDNLEDEFASAVLRVAVVGGELATADQLELVAEGTLDVPLLPGVLILGQDHMDLLAAAEVLEGLAFVGVTTGRVEDAGGAGDGRRTAGLQRRSAPFAFVQLRAAGIAQGVREVRGDAAALLAGAGNVQGALGGASLAK